MITQKEFNEIGKVLGDSSINDVIGNLYCRWEDEKQYEDFSDYENVMRTEFEKLNIKGATFLKATKRPFGFKFSCDYPKPFFYGIKGQHFVLSIVKSK